MYMYVYVCLYCAVEAQSIKVCALMTIHVCMYIVYSVQRQNSDISLIAYYDYYIHVCKVTSLCTHVCLLLSIVSQASTANLPNN